MSKYILVGSIHRHGWQEPLMGLRRAHREQYIPDGWEVVTEKDGFCVYEDNGDLRSNFDVLPLLRIEVK